MKRNYNSDVFIEMHVCVRACFNKNYSIENRGFKYFLSVTILMDLGQLRMYGSEKNILEYVKKLPILL